jgi:hypothetical protein
MVAGRNEGDGHKDGGQKKVAARMKELHSSSHLAVQYLSSHYLYYVRICFA